MPGKFSTAGIFILLTLYASKATISYQRSIIAYVGQYVDFKFTTNDNKSIIAAIFGVQNSTTKGCDYFKQKLISVNEIQGLNHLAEDRFKNRVEYIGNIKLGRAWFRVKNISVDDQNIFVGCIREGVDETYSSHKIRLVVKQQHTEALPTISQRSEPRYTDFEGIAEKRNSTEERPIILSNAIQAAYNHSISSIYDIRITSFEFRLKNKILQAKFHILFTKGINRTYALGFLKAAQQNNELEGYEITCFDVLRPNPRRDTGGNSSPVSPWVIVSYVLLGIVVILLIVFAILCMYSYGLVEPYIKLLRLLLSRLRNLCNGSS